MIFSYSTPDTKEKIMADGYFNETRNSRPKLELGDFLAVFSLAGNTINSFYFKISFSTPNVVLKEISEKNFPRFTPD